MELNETRPTTASDALLNDISSKNYNLGNSVFSCVGKVAVVDKTNYNQDYNVQHILFKTSSNSYGQLPAVPETCANTHNVLDRKFTSHLNKCGMYKNHSLNTELDKSKV